jgi:hypothetical protein
MQNVLWRRNTEDDSNSYPTFRGTPVVGINHVGLTLFFSNDMQPASSVVPPVSHKAWTNDIAG